MEYRTSVRRYIIDNFLFGDESAMVTDESSLMDAGVMDSTGVMEILAFLEETFGIAVEDEELTPDNFDTVAGIVSLIERKSGEAASA